jgi:hypothetical protein
MKSDKQGSLLYLIGSGTGRRATLVRPGLNGRDEVDGGDKDGTCGLREIRQDTALIARIVTEWQVAQGAIDSMAERVRVVMQGRCLYHLHGAQHQDHQQDELELP